MFISIIVACSVSALAINLMLHTKRSLPLDHPNQRSLHSRPIPRIGGVAILLGAGSGIAFSSPAEVIPHALLLALALAYILGALSLVDDFRGLPVTLRFALQIAASAALAWFNAPLPGGASGMVLVIFALVWMANLYNFMDGSNGLAGGMAVFGFGFYALASLKTGHSSLALISASIAAAAAAFLWFNFNPARIFMGDSGSIPLGFLAAALGLYGWQNGVWPVSFPLLTFSPFIFDASVTLSKRLLNKEKVWQAHREHYYQRLVRMGWGHRDTALLEYGLMAASGFSAMMLVDASNKAQVYAISAWLLLYGIFFSTVDKAWKNHQTNSD